MKCHISYFTGQNRVLLQRVTTYTKWCNILLAWSTTYTILFKTFSVSVDIYVRHRSTSNPQIHVRFLRQIYLYLRVISIPIRLSIVKYMAVSHFFKSTSNDLADVWPIVILTLMLTNKLATYLRIRKGYRFVKTFKSNRDLRSYRFEE
jgi:hypothetical protein